jgi:hypothetical protein
MDPRSKATTTGSGGIEASSKGPRPVKTVNSGETTRQRRATGAGFEVIMGSSRLSEGG